MEENQNIDYKRIWKDEYLQWICGFANAHGGKSLNIAPYQDNIGTVICKK